MYNSFNLKYLILLLFIFQTVSCTSNTQEERKALEKTIRKTNSVFKNYLANRDLERSFQSINPQNHFGRYRNSLQEIRGEVANFSKTEKYQRVRSDLDTLINASIKYFNSQIQIYNKNEDIINTTKSYRDNLEEFKSRFKSDKPGGNVRKEFNRMMGKMKEDSVNFRKNIASLKPIDSIHDSLANQIYMSKNEINSEVSRLNLSDSIQVKFDSLYYSPGGSSYEYFTDKELRPFQDVLNFMSSFYKNYE
jgi:hypothetical protein